MRTTAYATAYKGVGLCTLSRSHAVQVHFFGYSKASISNGLYSIDFRPLLLCKHIVQRQMVKFLNSRMSITDLHRNRT